MWGVLRRFGVMVLVTSLLLSMAKPGGEPKKPSSPLFMRVLQKNQSAAMRSLIKNAHYPLSQPPLDYDFYRDKCPHAVEIIRSTMTQLYSQNPRIAPAVLRLAFHDCFIHGCDASVLLGRIDGSLSERDAVPNQNLKGFDVIDAIKSKLEAACPATVSCADILVLAARDGVVLAGGPFYPLLTGRRDSEQSFYSESLLLPSPDNTYAMTLASFASRGFTDRETVSLLGAHSVGTVHCRFFSNRLSNFSGTGGPDGSLDVEMLEEMRAACGRDATTEDGGEGPGMAMGLRTGEQAVAGGRRTGRFDGNYYRQLLEARGIMHADQQLTAGRTVRWVWAYAAEGDGGWAFRSDFARSMVKLSGLRPLTGSLGQVRTRCSEVAGRNS